MNDNRDGHSEAFNFYSGQYRFLHSLEIIAVLQNTKLRHGSGSRKISFTFESTGIVKEIKLIALWHSLSNFLITTTVLLMSDFNTVAFVQLPSIIISALCSALFPPSLSSSVPNIGRCIHTDICLSPSTAICRTPASNNGQIRKSCDKTTRCPPTDQRQTFDSAVAM